MAKHVITQQVSANGAVIQTSATVTAPEEIDLDVTLAPATVNQARNIALTRANIQSLLLQSVGGDLTIKTNSTGAPADTVVMVNGQVILWSSAAVIGSNPFPTADVTVLYLSSTAGTQFTLRSINN